MDQTVIGPGFFGLIGTGVGAILLYALLGLLLILIGFWAVDITTPGPLNRMVRAGNPGSVVVTASGMLGMALVIVTAISVSSGTLLEGLLQTLIFGLVGIVAQVVAVRILEWVTGIDVGAVLKAENLLPQAWVVAAAQVAIGTVVAVAIV
ncbi:DUF350 domain-containing protein [Pseudonocardia sp. CA-107938]|uniref:DUF350 domain-containing protein n=1 Tax=Pseudonocardia sp. CA-107938 TaxID=3240021 RepID=UPI003D93179A